MNKWTISKEFHFSASHQLTGLPESHQCARLHGHNYIMTVRLSGSELVEPGFILDYGEMRFAKDVVDGMDHRHLNDLFPFNPTSENVVAHFYHLFVNHLAFILGSKRKLPEVSYLPYFRRHYQLEVGLSETPKTWAWYTELE